MSPKIRRIMGLAVLAGLGLTGLDVRAQDYWDCLVDDPSVVSEDTQGATIHSAGLLRFYDVPLFGWIDWERVIYAENLLRRQKDNVEMTRDSREASGEVHTYARTYVLKGHAYHARLSGRTSLRYGDSRPDSVSCSSGILILESEEGFEEGTNESPSGDGTDCTNVECWESPIVIDLDRGGFRFTDTTAGVAFDLVPGGEIERVAWTHPAGRDGFLALDRNGNGTIDDGSELFGNRSPQPPSDSPNGFRALAAFDRPDHGGDGDGWITSGDRIFDELRIWIDADHDGYSAPGELSPLAQAGINAIDLAYVESRRRDRHGNELRYSSRIRTSRATTQAVDVFLLVD